MDKLVDETSDGQMQFSPFGFSFINSNTFFLYKKPACKALDEESVVCCHVEPNAS